jgi:hypothetical protein
MVLLLLDSSTPVYRTERERNASGFKSSLFYGFLNYIVVYSKATKANLPQNHGV